jgi:hypothetical protein
LKCFLSIEVEDAKFSLQLPLRVTARGMPQRWGRRPPCCTYPPNPSRPGARERLVEAAPEVHETWVRVADLMPVDPPPRTARFIPVRLFPATGEYSTDATDSGLSDKCLQDPHI